MEDIEQDRVEHALAIVRRVRWWVLGVSAVLYMVLPEPESWVTTPAFALFWVSILVDSARAFRAGWRTPVDKVGASRP